MASRLVPYSKATAKTTSEQTPIPRPFPLPPRRDRPALIVSGTSWTADEDFGILLNAMDEYEEKAQAKDAKLPRVVCIITGAYVLVLCIMCVCRG